jgi:hypothetical protein
MWQIGDTVDKCLSTSYGSTHPAVVFDKLTQSGARQRFVGTFAEFNKGASMNVTFSQRLTEQCRGLLAGVRAPDVRDQLEMWIAELGAHAEVWADIVEPLETIRAEAGRVSCCYPD